MPTMNIPGIGSVEKKYVIVGAAGIAGFVGFMYLRSRNTANSDTSATDTTTDTSATDEAGYGADTFDPSAYSDYYGGGSVPVYQSPINQTIPVTSDQQITTDAAWDSAAVAAAGDMGADPGALSSALGRFLAGLCLSDAQADLVRQAEGMFGRPPQSPQLEIHICPATGTGGTGTKLGAPSGFHATKATKSSVCLAWNALPDSQGYHIKITGGGLNHTVVTHNLTYCVGSLKKSTTYTFAVMGYNAAGTGTASANVSKKTTSK